MTVRVGDEPDPFLWLTTPPIEDLGEFERERCAAAVSLSSDDLLADIPCQLLSAGNPNVYVAVRDPETVDRAEVESAAFYDLVRERDFPICTFVFAPVPSGAYSRMFAPEYGIVEDPATGSATGPLAAFMMRHGLVPKAHGTRFVSE